MRVYIDVADKEEGGQIREGLKDPEVRAFVRICGTLKQLPSDRSRERVLRYVVDSIEEKIEEAK